MSMSCSHPRTKRFGFYKRKCDGKRIQRFVCNDCRKTFSSQTAKLTYYSRKPWLDRALFYTLCSGVSQRRCAENFGLKQMTVARKIRRYAAWSERQALSTAKVGKGRAVVFDDLETFEHTKCKPLSVAIAVEEGTRRILSVRVSRMPAKGRLAPIARKKYGYRPDERRQGWREMFAELKNLCSKRTVFKSDENPHYPPVLRQTFPDTLHERFKGRKSCVVGQGELKRGGFDPLFSLNHTNAMFRDNLKTLSRKTWCTVKKVEMFKALLAMYRWYHNHVRLQRPAKWQQ